jgi:hypothetical protein
MGVSPCTNAGAYIKRHENATEPVDRFWCVNVASRLEKWRGAWSDLLKTFCEYSKNQNEKYKSLDSEDDDYIKMTRYYPNWAEANSRRQKGDRIYYEPGAGYYIVRPKKRNIWDRFSTEF